MLAIPLVILDRACQPFFNWHARPPAGDEIELCGGAINAADVDRLFIRRKRNNALGAAPSRLDEQLYEFFNRDRALAAKIEVISLHFFVRARDQ